MNVKKFLTDADLETISSAIKESEKKTGGELVLRIDSKSDDYSEAYWKSGAVFFVIYIIIAAFTQIYGTGIIFMNSVSTALAGAALSFAAGATVSILIPPYRRLIIGRDVMHYYTDLRAREAFLQEEVFNTKLRTGILIYLSLFEKTAVILSDSGINAKVPEDEWHAISCSLISGIKQKKKAEAISRSIKMCGDLLVKAGVGREKDDIDELSNDVRLGR